MPPVGGRLVDVEGDGNCFFRALYGAAKDAGILEQVCGAFAVDEDSNCWEKVRSERDRVEVVVDGLRTGLFVNKQELEFVACARDSLAARLAIAGVEGERLRRFYDSMKELESVLDPDDYKSSVLESQPLYIVTALENAADAARFARSVADHVRVMGNWVGQLEVGAVKAILNKSKSTENESLRIICVSNVSELDGVTRDNADLTIVNVNTMHYQYIKWDEELRGGGKQKANRKSPQSTQRRQPTSVKDTRKSGRGGGKPTAPPTKKATASQPRPKTKGRASDPIGIARLQGKSCFPASLNAG
jgi:hypothetical protein